MAARRPREDVLEAKGRYLAEALGGMWVKLKPTSGQSFLPDRAFILPNASGFIELKRSGERPTPEQLHVLAGLRAAGFEAGWADDMDGLCAFMSAVSTRDKGK